MTTGEGRRTVYIETSVVSYLTARPTSNLLAAAWQKATADWWDAHRPRFDICTSDLTIEEAGRGNPEAAARRLQALGGIDLLPITEAVVNLSVALLHDRALPENAQNDALHIGASAVHGVDYLMTWNFRHSPTPKPDASSAASVHSRATPVQRSVRQLNLSEAWKMSDEIIEELWQVKDDIARENEHDVRRLADYLRGQTRVALDRTADRPSVNETAGTDRTMESAVEGLS